MEARRREEEEKKKCQNRRTWQIIIVTTIAVILIATLGIVVPTILENAAEDTAETETETERMEPAPSMDELDFSSITLDNYTDTEEITNYVRLNVSYTDANGLLQNGNIVIRLFEKVAPATVENFQTLVSQGFYDELTFHRIYPGFMIQGGDPNGDGSGNAGKTLKGEFTKNGFENNLSHVRGVVSMARGGYSYDSASCQFFIVHNDSQSTLDGLYASFGYVVYGMDTVDAITGTDLKAASGSVDSRPTSPVSPVTIHSATFLTAKTTD